MLLSPHFSRLSLAAALSPPPKLFPPIPRSTRDGLKLASSLRNLHKPFICATASHQFAEPVDASGEVSGDGGAAVDGGTLVLPAGLRRESLPRHVAVIMDGNRRWARLRDLPVEAGYEAGLRSLREMVNLCCRWGIRVLTVYAFSTDNWFRPRVEVETVMNLFESGLKELGTSMRENIRISAIGDTSRLPKPIQEQIMNVEEATKSNSQLHLIVALSYSGQSDIVQACQRIAWKVKDGFIDPKDINESLFEQELKTNLAEPPCPDLLIRTSGELRVSNFLLWQLAYTELFFAQSLWPDFGEAEFLKALLSFQQRQRRYGKGPS